MVVRADWKELEQQALVAWNVCVVLFTPRIHVLAYMMLSSVAL